MMESVQMAHRPVQAGEMLPLLKRHEIQVLLRAGHAQRDVAVRTGTSLNTVRRVKHEGDVKETDDAVERRARGVGRPSKTASFASQVLGWLSEDSDLPTQELLRRAKEQGYSGNKTAFYALVAGVRPPRAAPVVRFEGLPGEFSQHDFGHVDVTFVDGRRKRVHFFASRLKYSRSVRVTLVDNERVETIVRCLARDFVAFGGLPLMAVFDRPKTIVRKGGKGRDVEAYNATFAQAIVDIGVGVEMCAPRSGNQKGTVERLVGWVKSAFFKHRKFQDEADLEAQLAAWLAEGRKALGADDPFVSAALGVEPAAEVAKHAMSGTRLADPAARKALLDGGPGAIDAAADPLLALARRVEPVVRELRAWREERIQSVDASAGTRIAQARFAVFGKTAYPDANFNLRLTYGTVLGYEEDTTRVPYKTTFYGLFERAAAFDETPPYDLPRRWREGRAALDLSVPFNFVYTADTIGGNSGSPVINRRAEIVGINFDSNIQKLPNRYVYIDEAEGSRAVGVHAAGIVEGLRKLYGAEALVRELTGEGGRR